MLMKKIFLFIVGLVMSFSLTSCVTAAYAQLDDEADISVIVSNGTPYYNTDGLLMYYIYRDLYYYPYYYNNGWHFRHYARPLPPRHHRPVPRDFYHHRPHQPSYHHTPHPGGTHRPDINRGGHAHRHVPNNINRGGNRPSGRHFGGKR